MASLLLLIKTQHLSQHESTCNCRNQRLILCNVLKLRRLRDDNGTRYATKCEIRDVLRHDNFVAKTNVNLIDKTTNLATHSQVFNIF